MKVLIFSTLVIFATCFDKSNRRTYNLKSAPDLYVEFIKVYPREFENYYDILIHYDAFYNTLRKINVAGAKEIKVLNLDYTADWTDDEVEVLTPKIFQ